jgi:hypothetical protein
MFARTSWPSSTMRRRRRMFRRCNQPESSGSAGGTNGLTPASPQTFGYLGLTLVVLPGVLAITPRSALREHATDPGGGMVLLVK